MIMMESLLTVGLSLLIISNLIILEPLKSLMKVGHALHMTPGPFQDMVTSEKSKQILKELNYNKVSVPQSMVIFKQAKIGSAVQAHQDSTFSHTAPKQTVIGMIINFNEILSSN